MLPFASVGQMAHRSICWPLCCFVLTNQCLKILCRTDYIFGTLKPLDFEVKRSKVKVQITLDISVVNTIS